QAATNPENSKFNEYFSRARVTVEHTAGLLKSWFESLRGLRVKLRIKEDSKNACDWIVCVLALNNFLLSLNDDWDVDAVNEDDDQQVVDNPVTESGAEFRKKIQAHLLAFYGDRVCHTNKRLMYLK
ncbi:hypothetical protein MP638_006439, partial [Amoeboaphelidium occidentale]